jgi:threonylcarbamoyladenosine tRNA methylthiotransferase MtaB
MKIKFYTLGCKVNQYETQALKEEFSALGCKLSDSSADLCVINTCTVTSRADAKSREMIQKAKRQNPHAKIAVCGCMAEKSFAPESLGVDYVIAQKNKQSVADIIFDRPLEKKDIWSLKINSFPNHRAFVKIQDGCDNTCFFCKVRFVRGKSQSRPQNEILEEIKKVSLEHKEIVLCGINLALYGRDLNPAQSLYGLVERILALDSLGRLRLSSLEPAFLEDKIFKLFDNKKMCPHLHFPFQSGDDKVLREINKRETVSLYEEVVSNLRKNNSLFAVSCDIIVGFPFENEQAFKNTVNFLKKVKPMRTHIFTFSARPNTPFYGIKPVKSAEIAKRKNYLKELTNMFSLEYKQKFLGKSLYVIAEEKKDSYICGYSENYLKIFIKDKVALGGIYPVKVTEIDKDKVFARTTDCAD